MHVETKVTATPQNFDPILYILANADLLEAAKADSSFDPVQHYKKYGFSEGRQQISVEIFDMMKRKYSIFYPTLDLVGYKFLKRENEFPVASLAKHFELTDYTSESSNISPFFWSQELEANPDKLYIDIGAGMRDFVFDNCLYIEVYPSLIADVIMTPNTKLPFLDASLDGVGCFSVMEHVEDPYFLAREIKRVVKPGGKLFIDWPFLQPFHGYPSHFYNATHMGLKRMFEDAFTIKTLESYEWQQGDSTLNWILNWFIDGISDSDLREDFLSLNVRQLRELPVKGDFYKRCLASMSPEARMRISAGTTLIGSRITP
jgi:SAM-dependent methyltransferase